MLPVEGEFGFISKTKKSPKPKPIHFSGENPADHMHAVLGFMNISDPQSESVAITSGRIQARAMAALCAATVFWA